MATVKSRFCFDPFTEIRLMGSKPVSAFKTRSRSYFNSCHVRALSTLLILIITAFPQTALTQQEASKKQTIQKL